MKTFLLLLSLIAASAFGMELESDRGTDQGNGGDAYAADFVGSANFLARFVAEENSLAPSVKEKYALAVRKVQVESTDAALKLLGIPKDALNFPESSRILFNRQRWISMSAKEKFSLVLHEYFSVVGEENASYAVSSLILDKVLLNSIPKCSFDPSVKAAPTFLRPPRHANSANYSLAEAFYRGGAFSLRKEGRRLWLEVRGSNGMILASASSTIDSVSLFSELRLQVTVLLEGEPISVTCEGKTLGFSPAAAR